MSVKYASIDIQTEFMCTSPYAISRARFPAPITRTGAPLEEAQHAHHVDGNADIKAARDHRLPGLAGTVGIDDRRLQTMLLEDTGELTDFRSEMSQ